MFCEPLLGLFNVYGIGKYIEREGTSKANLSTS